MNKVNKQDGFTLIDVTIMLLVIGFIVAPMIQVYHQWQQRNERSSTLGKIQAIEQATQEFYFANKYYPCPADPRLGPGNANFGIEARLPPVAPATLGNCANPVMGPGAPDAVLYGSIPFATLGLDEKTGLDAWNNKMAYAVSPLQTHDTTYTANGGVIRVNHPFITGPDPNTGENSKQANPSPNAANIHLIIFSYGETGAGAYTYGGAQPVPCPNGPAPGTGPEGDAENCDGDDTFRFAQHLYNTNAVPDFYDDLMYADETAWTQEPNTAWVAGNNPGQLGSDIGYVGVNNPNPQAELDIVGNILADNTDTENDATDGKLGNVYATEFCDENRDACMDPNTIAGEDPNMRCNLTNYGLTGIGSNKAKCIEATTITSNQDPCGEGEIVKSLDENGNFVCGNI
ncbi:MAG: hypothetical protein KDI46_07165 [Alphaproteobacteria bacterium]|nr:hypothetical protein [Alphaproteobacteria bacterium]